MPKYRIALRSSPEDDTPDYAVFTRDWELDDWVRNSEAATYASKQDMEWVMEQFNWGDNSQLTIERVETIEDKDIEISKTKRVIKL